MKPQLGTRMTKVKIDGVGEDLGRHGIKDDGFFTRDRESEENLEERQGSNRTVVLNMIFVSRLYCHPIK